MMIKLSDGCYVAASEIAEVRVNTYRTSLIVRTRDGVGHSHGPVYGQSIFTTLDNLIAEINAAGVQPHVTNT